MDNNKIIIRNIIRVLGIIAGAITGIVAFVFRRIGDTDEKLFMGCCKIARIGAVVLFVLAIAFMIYDIILKAYPISIGAIGLALATLAFVGSFIIAPGCSEDAMMTYILKHVNVGSVDAIAEKLATQLSIGSWMVVAGGIFYATYNSGCMKQGK